MPPHLKHCLHLRARNVCGESLSIRRSIHSGSEADACNVLESHYSRI